MARVSFGKLRGEADFSRVVAVKQLFPQYARDPEFVAMFLDEARVAARVRHPNVVGTLDIVSDDGELFLVMEYIAGEPLSRLLASAAAAYEPIEPAIISRVLIDFLEGLHAAHTATGPSGEPLHIVHRDVSPQNVLVGVDGVSRVVDFGVAKAMGRLQKTDDGQVKGKIVYMPPEQMGKEVDLRADLWAAGAVLWEMLAGRRLFTDMGQALAYHSGHHGLEAPSVVGRRETPLDAVAIRALSRDPKDRYQTAREMIIAIERAVPPAPARRVGQWVERLAADALAKRRALVAEVEAYRPESDSFRSAGASGGAPLPWAASVRESPPATRSRMRVVLPVSAVLALAAAAAIVVVARRGANGAEPARATTTNAAGPSASASASASPSPHSSPGPETSSSPTAGASAIAATTPSSRPAATAGGGGSASTPRPKATTRPRSAAATSPSASAGTASPEPTAASPTIPPAHLPASADPGDPRELHRRK